MRISIRWKLLLPILLSGVVICVIAHRMIVGAAIRQVEALSTRDAQAMSKYIGYLRAYYTANVVADARAAGLQVSHEHQGDGKTIPLPATMVHELNAQMHQAEGGADRPSVRLFSPYPFAWRTEGGIKSALDQQDWDALARDPATPIARTIEDNGQPTIRYATADTMKVAACVECHNNHPQSPRRGWKLGDTRGVLLVSVPMGAALEGARADANRATWMIVGVVILSIAAIMLLAQRALFTPMGELRTVARQIAAGDLTGSVRYHARDELGDVADSFRSATAHLGRISDAVTLLGKGELDTALEPASERDVVSRSVNLASVELRDRAAKLLARNADMRLVLDNVAQGLLTVGLDGKISAECSAIVTRWFGEPPASRLLWDYLAPIDRTFCQWLVLGWDSLRDGFLPTDLLLDQLPRRLRHGDRHLAATYQAITRGDGALAQILVVLSDVTERIEAERLEAQQREVLAVFKRMLADRVGTVEFLAEVEDLIARIAERREASPEELARMVHTVKGNCAIFDVGSVAMLCHELEERAKETGALDDADRAQLKHAWSTFSERVGVLLGNGTNNGAILIDPSEYDAFLDQLVEGVPRSDLAREITRWRLDRVQPRLERLGEQARLMAQRLGKEVDVEVEATTLRLASEDSKALWLALVHPVRNAIDHGIESGAEREKASKAPSGKLMLRAVPSPHHVTIEIEDDGRGIDWEAVRGRADGMGLRSRSRTDLVEALFADGLSTKREASELSGRGVGMSALRTAVRDLNGTIDVKSRPGGGTLVRISVAIEGAADEPVRRRALRVTQ